MRKEAAPSRMFVKDAEDFRRKSEFYDLATATFITEPAATELARFEGILNLSGFNEMPTKIAAILASGRCSNLILNGLSRVNSGLINALSAYTGQIHLQGVTRIDHDTAQALARCRARAVYLENLCDMDIETVKSLSSNCDIIISELLKKKAPDIIDGEAGMRFIEDQAAVYLSAARELTEEGAAAIAKYSGALDLTGLKRISNQCAQLLSQHRGPLILDFKNLELSADGAEALSIHNPEPNDYELLIKFLIRHKITKECANWFLGQHYRYFADELVTRYAKEVTDEASDILASKNTRILHLGSVVRLSDHAATALSNFQGEEIILDGLKYLSMQAALALTDYKGTLSLKSLEEINSEEGKLLIRHMQNLVMERLRLEEINRREQDRAMELHRIERERENIQLENHKIEQERLAELNDQKNREEKRKRDFISALRFLDHFKISYPKEESRFSIVNFIESLFTEPDKRRERYVSNIIEGAEKVSRSMQKKKIREYLFSEGIDNGNNEYTDLIFAVYRKRYHRITHCFRCREGLVSSLSNECSSCGWILCSCGACGCNYSGR